MLVKFENIPQELKDKPSWAVWRNDMVGDKARKTPYQTNGNRASSTEPKHWGPFEKAKKVYEDSQGKENYSGVGFTLGNGGSGYTVIDLDDCLDEKGNMNDLARDILGRLDSYTEVSPSGVGLKIWVRGKKPEGTKWPSRRGNIEVYDHARYLTVTGNTYFDGETFTTYDTIQDGGVAFENFLIFYMLPEDKSAGKDVEVDIEAIEHALEYIDSSCDYEQWLRIGMALHALGDDKFDLWDEWSSEGTDYPGTEECKKKWNSFGGGTIGIGSLFYFAKQNPEYQPHVKKTKQRDWEVAHLIKEELSGEALYIREWKSWAAWNGKRFEIDSERRVYEATVAVADKLLLQCPESDGSKEGDKKVKTWRAWCEKYTGAQQLKSMSGLTATISGESFTKLDQRTDLFHCDNTVLRFEDSGAVGVLPHSPEFKNTSLSEVEYDKNAKCPLWLDFIDEITCGSEALADYLQRVVGFCLTGRTDDQSLYVLYGNGRNGKGAFTRTILKLLGEYGAAINQSILMETRRTEHQTQFASLYGKRCLIAQETDAGGKLNEAQVKQLTGGDPIRCRRMQENEWVFIPTHKVMLVTNNLPNIRGTDVGIWRRIKPIPFEAEVVPDPELEPALLGELSGILNWALEGLRKVVQEGGFVLPPEVEAARNEYRESMDIVGQFVEDRCELGDDLKISNADLHASIRQYCESIGLYTPSIRKVSDDLKKMGIKNGKSNGDRYQVGIGLRPVTLAEDEFA